MEVPDAPERVALCVGLPHAPEAPRLARREVSGALVGRLPRPIAENLLLVVSELVANAVRHGAAGVGPGISLALELDRRRVRIAAMDGGRARRSASAHDRVGGWGLELVDRLADRWGFSPGRPTVAWAEFDLISSPGAPTPNPGARTAPRAR